MFKALRTPKECKYIFGKLKRPVHTTKCFEKKILDVYSDGTNGATEKPSIELNYISQSNLNKNTTAKLQATTDKQTEEKLTRKIEKIEDVSVVPIISNMLAYRKLYDLVKDESTCFPNTYYDDLACRCIASSDDVDEYILKEISKGMPENVHLHKTLSNVGKSSYYVKWNPQKWLEFNKSITRNVDIGPLELNSIRQDYTCPGTETKGLGFRSQEVSKDNYYLHTHLGQAQYSTLEESKLKTKNIKNPCTGTGNKEMTLCEMLNKVRERNRCNSQPNPFTMDKDPCKNRPEPCKKKPDPCKKKVKSSPCDKPKGPKRCRSAPKKKPCPNPCRTDSGGGFSPSNPCRPARGAGGGGGPCGTKSEGFGFASIFLALFSNQAYFVRLNRNKYIEFPDLNKPNIGHNPTKN